MIEKLWSIRRLPPAIFVSYALVIGLMCIPLTGYARSFGSNPFVAGLNIFEPPRTQGSVVAATVTRVGNDFAFECRVRAKTPSTAKNAKGYKEYQGVGWMLFSIQRSRSGHHVSYRYATALTRHNRAEALSIHRGKRTSIRRRKPKTQ
jgi:hypothetical protein